MQIVLKALDARRFKNSRRPLQAILKNDGGPTKKEEGYVGLYLALDSRLRDDWKKAPQSKLPTEPWRR